MFKQNKTIDSLQLFAIGAMIGNALFVGMGNIIIVKIASQNTWIVGLVSMVLGILPVLLICKVMNYEPELTLPQKIKKLFGNKIGAIINFILGILIFAVLLISVWGLSIFSNVKYLAETPLTFIAFIFMIPLVYSCLKGIETISRTILFLLYIGIICHVVITFSLTEFVEFKNVKPILVDGFSPIIEGSLKFITYAATPFVTLLMIPKANIKNPKHTTLAILGGYIYVSMIMAIVFFMSVSTVGIEIASMYRYPEYFIVKKVSIGNIFENVENFFSVVWIFNLVSCSMLCLYYVVEYICQARKIIDSKKRTYLILIIAIITIYISSKMFVNDTVSNNFMRHIYPFIIGLPVFGIIFLTYIVSKFKKDKHQHAEKSIT